VYNISWKKKATEIERGSNVIQVAKENGTIQHFVYLSSSGANRNTGIEYFDSKYELEQMLKKSGLPYTILRPVFFMENFLTSAYTDIKNGVYKTFLRPNNKLQLISIRDIGRFTLHVFDNPDKCLGKEYDIIADELTQTEIALILNCRYERVDINKVEESVRDLYQWQDAAGFNANIVEIKKVINFCDFRTWATKKKLGSAKKPASGEST